MKPIQMFQCSFCGEVFEDIPSCKEHEKTCSKFISTYKGIININRDTFRENFIGEMPMDDLCDIWEGYEVEIKRIKVK